MLLVQVHLAEALLAEGRRQDALDLMKTLLTAAKAAPFPLPAWRMAELQIVYALALSGIGSDKEAAVLVDENTAEVQDYNLAALKRYLNRPANPLRRSVQSREQSSLS
jgi:hypothetical protein